MKSSGTQKVDRSPTEEELALLIWLIEKSRAKIELMTQLEGIKVVGECGCGCASFDLEPQSGSAKPAKVNGEVSFTYDRVGDSFCNGFLWVCQGWLAGIDLSVIGEIEGECRLPNPEEIEGYESW